MDSVLQLVLLVCVRFNVGLSLNSVNIWSMKISKKNLSFIRFIAFNINFLLFFIVLLSMHYSVCVQFKCLREKILNEIEIEIWIFGDTGLMQCIFLNSAWTNLVFICLFSCSFSFIVYILFCFVCFFFMKYSLFVRKYKKYNWS